VSVISMHAASESLWWKGKLTIPSLPTASTSASTSTPSLDDEHLTKVGYFPSRCVQLFATNVHRQKLNNAPTDDHGCVQLFLGPHFTVVAGVRALRQMWKRFHSRKATLVNHNNNALPPVFGTDLTLHVQSTASSGKTVKSIDKRHHSVPQILIVCASFIENHAITNGIYRSPGIKSNVEMLR